MSRIIYIMGKSSSGKDCLFKELKRQRPELKEIVPYTTRPIREGEQNGVEYYFVDEEELRDLELKGKIIERRAYNTKHGIWNYFTVDDGQINLSGQDDYIVIGTLESYAAMKAYYGGERIVPVYVEVEDGLRLFRAVERERAQAEPKYAEMCRRFLADSEDFSEENLAKAGIVTRFQNDDFEKCLDEICAFLF